VVHPNGLMGSQSGLAESLVNVSVDPLVELLVAQSGGRPDHALLVVHGGPDWDHTYLRDPLVRLGGMYRLIMLDIRGCGRSTTGLPATCYTPDAVVSDLLSLIDALSLDTVSVLGFSYGGLLVQRLVARAPGRFHKLIIASSSIYPVPDDAYAHWPDRDEREAARLAAWADNELDGPAKVRAAAIAGARSDVWRHDRLAGYLDQLNRVRFGAEWLRPWRAGILPAAGLERAEHVLAEIGIPILFLHGSHDTTIPVSLAARAAGQIEGARVAVIDGAGHMTHVDEPDQWMAAVEGFLAQ
jgi:pimeloyl-ACP methyl ester carboxylesterase